MSTPDASPFFLPRGDRAVLCLHGFTGSPYEVRPLGEALAQAGFTVLAPRLPGHRSVQELSTTNKEEWKSAVSRALDALSQAPGIRGPVGIVGVSMGGTLALWLAAQEPARVAAVATLGTPMFLSPTLTKIIGWAERVRLDKWVRSLPKIAGSDIADDQARKENPTLPGTPIAAVYQFQRLLEEVREQLSAVQAPLWLAHGMGDRTVPPQNLDYLAAHTGSPSREVRRYPASRHLLSLDKDRDAVAAGVVEFFQTQLGAPQPATVHLAEDLYV